MAWSYDETDLTTATAAGRLNVVRLLVGDTDTNDQQLQDEEINFALDQAGDDVYFAAAWSASTLSSKYARLVTTDLDGALKEELSDLHKHYKLLAIELKQKAQSYSGNGVNIYAGGLTESYIEAKRANTNLVRPAFERDRWRYYGFDDDDRHYGYQEE